MSLKLLAIIFIILIILMFLFQCKNKKSKNQLYIEEFKILGFALLAFDEKITKDIYKGFKEQLKNFVEEYKNNSKLSFVIFSSLIIQSNKKVKIKTELLEYLKEKYPKDSISYGIHKQNKINKHIYYFLVKCFGFKKFKTPSRDYIGFIVLDNKALKEGKKSFSFKLISYILNSRFLSNLIETIISLLIIFSLLFLAIMLISLLL